MEYVWWSERKSFLKTSLNENRCDVVMGVPLALDSVLVTRPYYRSTYVFVTRADSNLNLTSLADDRLSAHEDRRSHAGRRLHATRPRLAHRGNLSVNIVGFPHV